MSARDDPSVRRLVRGVLWPGFLGRTMPDWVKRERDEGLAGVVYFSQNLDAADSEAAARLSAQLADGGDRVLVGIDEEGGSVTRLEAQHGSTLPGAFQLGTVDDVAATRAVGRELARRAANAGANVVLAPDADVNTNPQNPVIGVRAFGDEPQLVSRHVAALVDGLRRGGVASCAKHYPGHGDTAVDSHSGLPRVDGDVAAHLLPFDAAIAAGVDAIMTAHIVVAGRGELPATLNSAILGELRERGFRGAIITDALDMAAIRSSVGSGVGGAMALAAGADLLCIGNPANPGTPQTAAPDEDCYIEVRDAVCDALDDGALSLGRLEDAARRVDALRDAARGDADFAPELGHDEALAIARRAASTVGSAPALSTGVVLLDARAAASNAVSERTDAFTPAISELGACTRVVVGAELPPIPGTARPVIIVDRLAEQRQRALVAELARRRSDGVVINAGIPDRVPHTAMIALRADSLISARVAAELLRTGFSS